MITFLQKLGIKAHDEISAIATEPNLLFSNDPCQTNAEARYNVRSIHKLNKLLRKKTVTVHQLQTIVHYVEACWGHYLRQHFRGKSFVFYVWGEWLTPCLNVSVISYYEGARLPFGCALHHATDVREVLLAYVEHACFEGIPVVEWREGSDVDEGSDERVHTLTVYSKIIVT